MSADEAMERILRAMRIVMAIAVAGGIAFGLPAGLFIVAASALAASLGFAEGLKVR